MMPDWTPSDAAALNEFLNTPLGRKWLGILLAHKPRIDMESSEKAALSGAFIAGYEHLLFHEIGINRMAGSPKRDSAGKPGIDPEKD